MILGQQAQKTLTPGPEFLGIEGVAQAEHGARVLDVGELLAKLAADALGG